MFGVYVDGFLVCAILIPCIDLSRNNFELGQSAVFVLFFLTLKIAYILHQYLKLPINSDQIDLKGTFMGILIL